MNLFATVLTYPAPSANYRGESEENRTVIQKITYGRFEYPVISPESIRNALRETLASYGLPCNRSRLHDEEQLAVRFKDYPDPERYADDFFFAYLVAASGDDRRKIKRKIIANSDDPRGADLAERLSVHEEQLKKLKGNSDEEKKQKKQIEDQIKELVDGFDGFSFKRDSVFRMNLARSVEPYRNNAIFTQSPRTTDDSPWQNAKTSALLHRETSLTAFQFPFALNLENCRPKAEWTRKLLQAIGELNGVAGNHARSYYEMAPASIVIRLTNQLVAGYDTYGFDTSGDFPEVINGVLHEEAALDNNRRPRKDDKDRPILEPRPDYPGSEFFIGGKVAKDMDPVRAEKLKERGVTLERDPRRLLTTVADKVFPAKGA